MTAIPSSALLGQFAGDITPAGQAVFGLKAQPFTDNHGAVLHVDSHHVHSLYTSFCLFSFFVYAFFESTS